MSINVTIHGAGTGTCSLTGKESADGLTVTFEDGTVREAFLSWKSFKQLLALKTNQGVKPELKHVARAPLAAPVGNGNG
jgi:hypothetical protein